MHKDYKIDFVVTWLDSNDPEWQKEYWHYRGEPQPEDNGRYRNWDIFKYWFRAVEKYAPWVNKVYLVTNGKNPEWINSKCSKLVLVKHSDYMPDDFLPSFSSRAIELNFHRIKDLSEHFVYFNDDCFINSPITPDYYFKNGLPCDCNAEKLGITPIYSFKNKFSNRISVFCDIAILNSHFDRRKTIKQSPWRWYGPHLLWQHFMASVLLYGKKEFQAFALRHLEQPMLKSVIKDIWDAEPKILEMSCSQFRQDVSLNPYIIRYWQFATNNFYPIPKKYGKYFGLGINEIDNICETLMESDVKSVCLNDGPLCNDETYVEIKKILHELFEKKFPDKSSFEL